MLGSGVWDVKSCCKGSHFRHHTLISKSGCIFSGFSAEMLCDPMGGMHYI